MFKKGRCYKKIIIDLFCLRSAMHITMVMSLVADDICTHALYVVRTTCAMISVLVCFH